MNKSELMSFVKSDSIKNLVSAKEVQTETDIKQYKDKGYNIGFVYDTLKQILPEKVAENIYYNKGIEQTYYYDKDKYVLFPVSIYGKSAFKPFEEIGVEVMERAIIYEKDTANGEFYPLLISLNDKMRMEILNRLVAEEKTDKAYELFKSFYPMSDFGCSEIKLSSVCKIAEYKSDEEKNETKEALKGYPDVIKIYRGTGDKSASVSQTVSWTTDINIANFFATRLPGEKASIYEAEVNKDDVIEYFSHEKECIILPQNVRIKEQIPIFGSIYLESKIQEVTDDYAAYRDLITEYVDFQIDDDEHGKLHSARVMLNSLILANEMDLSEADIDKLCTAAAFHDSMRDNNDEDENHGKKSAEYYKDFANDCPDIVKYDKTVEQLIRYHSMPDDEGVTAFSEDDIHLFKIFKDADALDRVRFGIRALDVNQLRTPIAKSLTMVANIIADELKLPEQEQGMNMT